MSFVIHRIINREIRVIKRIQNNLGDSCGKSVTSQDTTHKPQPIDASHMKFSTNQHCGFHHVF